MHRGRLVAGFWRFFGTIEAGSAKLQIEQPFVCVAPLSRFGYGYAQPVIPADWLRHPLNSNVRPYEATRPSIALIRGCLLYANRTAVLIPQTNRYDDGACADQVSARHGVQPTEPFGKRLFHKLWLSP